MMEQRAGELSQTTDKLVNDIKGVIIDGQDLLNAAASASSANFAVAREKFHEKLGSVKAAVGNASRLGVQTAKKAAGTANDNMRGNPWTVIGIAAAVGVLVGFLAAKR